MIAVRPPAPSDWTDRLTWDDGVLALRTPAMIDVGAVGKGRLVDIVHDLLGSLGHAERDRRRRRRPASPRPVP